MTDRTNKDHDLQSSQRGRLESYFFGGKASQSAVAFASGRGGMSKTLDSDDSDCDEDEEESMISSFSFFSEGSICAEE